MLLFFIFIRLISTFFPSRYLDSNPWNCSDCNVQDLGNKSAYNDVKGQEFIAYCSNNASLGDIDNAPSNFTCTERTTITTTTLSPTPAPTPPATPKTEDTNELSTTEVILIAVGGVVFSAFAGFAIYKGVQKYKSANGYTYVFQA